MRNTQYTYLYRHYDVSGNLLYVGISMSIAQRMARHKAHSRWFADIVLVKVEKFLSRDAALDAELQAIRSEKPKYNVLGVSPADDTTASDEPPGCYEEDSRLDVVRQIVSFQPTYDVASAAKALSLSESKVRRLIDEGKIGHVPYDVVKDEWDSVKRRSVLITGWQLIDFLEAAQAGRVSLDRG